MNRFILVRHGETENNRVGRLSGWVDTPLTEAGLAKTDAAIAKLRGMDFDAVYTSDLGRAFITAYRVVMKLGLEHEIIALPGLREVNYGDVAHMLRKEVYAKYPGIDSDTHFTPPNGESIGQMQARVLATVIGLDQAHTDDTILLVAHSGTMAALNSSYQSVDFGGHNISEAYPHDYVASFTVSDGKVASFEQVV
jgi:probable phosphoglycerate mutase